GRSVPRVTRATAAGSFATTYAAISPQQATREPGKMPDEVSLAPTFGFYGHGEMRATATGSYVRRMAHASAAGIRVASLEPRATSCVGFGERMSRSNTQRSGD